MSMEAPFFLDEMPTKENFYDILSGLTAWFPQQKPDFHPFFCDFITFNELLAQNVLSPRLLMYLNTGAWLGINHNVAYVVCTRSTGTRASRH